MSSMLSSKLRCAWFWRHDKILYGARQTVSDIHYTGFFRCRTFCGLVRRCSCHYGSVTASPYYDIWKMLFVAWGIQLSTWVEKH